MDYNQVFRVDVFSNAKIDGVNYPEGVYYILSNEDGLNITGDYEKKEVNHIVTNQERLYVKSSKLNSDVVEKSLYLDDLGEFSSGESMIFEFFADDGFISKSVQSIYTTIKVNDSTTGNVQMLIGVGSRYLIKFSDTDNIQYIYNDLTAGSVEGGNLDYFNQVLNNLKFDDEVPFFVEIRNTTDKKLDSLVIEFTFYEEGAYYE